MHPPLDAVREAVDGRSVAPDDIERIVISTFKRDDMDHDLTVMMSVKFSTPYVLTRYLHDGDLDLSASTGVVLADEVVQRLALRVYPIACDDFEAAFPESWGARTVMMLWGGSHLTGTRQYLQATTAT
jgi:2-methylcitrate dehydratase PrpD